MTQPKPNPPPVPSSSLVTDLEERFVMTVFHNRMLIKKLRQVRTESYMSQRARSIARSLLEGRPVLDPIEGLEPFTSDEMAQAVEMIADNHLMRQTIGYGRRLYEVSRAGDIEAVRKTLADRPMESVANFGGAVGESAAKYLKQVAMGTSFKQLDSPLAAQFPLEAGAIHVLAGGPGGGKSAWSECIALELSNKGVAVLDVSIELTEIPKYARYAQHLYGPSVGIKAYVTGTVDHRLLAQATRELQANTNLKMATGISTIHEVKDAIRHHVQESGVRVVMIDFIQNISVPGVPDLYPKLEIITSELKRLGDELGIAQFWLAQLSREGRKGITRPTMEHVEGSGRIEQLAWTAAVLHAQPRAPGSELRDVEIYIDKSRYDEVGLLKGKFHGAYYDFYVSGQKPLRDRIGEATSLPLVI